MGTYAVTGAASGIGAATTALLRERGHRVITVDRRDADVAVDLATAKGRARAVREIDAACSGKLNGVVPCAGLAGVTGSDSAALVSVNYFGAVEVVTRAAPGPGGGGRGGRAVGGGAAVVELGDLPAGLGPGRGAGVPARRRVGRPGVRREPRGGAGLPGDEGGPGVVGTSRGCGVGVDRGRRPGQRRRSRPRGHADDRRRARRPGPRTLRRPLPHRDRTTRAAGGGGGDDRLPALGGGEPAGGFGARRRRRHRRPHLAAASARSRPAGPPRPGHLGGVRTLPRLGRGYGRLARVTRLGRRP